MSQLNFITSEIELHFHYRFIATWLKVLGKACLVSLCYPVGVQLIEIIIMMSKA